MPTAGFRGNEPAALAQRGLMGAIQRQALMRISATH
eukprot:CAMPEP_0170241652 /NCGR_PEP_ID=MMETSP0116_2-20130129/20596_1 /TAXON_ID=400756 /ORGANISM="Durinskia baltica, Strain CSIRO CS-38" /LENGTH=35 /DNA_ID= /DNA_START= /DNA_END= /DNA_ORIENTATION=